MPRHNLINRYNSSTISSNYISSDEEDNKIEDNDKIEDDVLKKILEKTATIKIQIKELKNKYILNNGKLNEQLIKNSSVEQLREYYYNIITKMNELCEQVASLKDTSDLIKREIKNRNIISDSD